MTQLHLDLNAPRQAVNSVWTFGGDAGHAASLLRADVRRQIRICHEELGFRHVRCAGILSDDMGVAQDDGTYDFTKVERVLDVLLEAGLTPLLDLSAVPRSLTRDGLQDCEPAEWPRWHALIHAFATFLDGRYGCDVEQWHFEIDRSDEDVPPENFFRLYDIAAGAIKQVQPAYRVGGPGAVSAASLDAFLEHVAEKRNPSRQHSSGASRLSEAGEGAETTSQPSDELKAEASRCDFITARLDPREAASDAALRERFAAARARVTATLGEATPLFCTEVHGPAGDESTSAHDACDFAAFTCQTVVALAADDACQGVVVQNISDIDFPIDDSLRRDPFHGGRGLLTVNDVRKAAFNALHILRQHGGYHALRVPFTWSDSIDGLGCLATMEEHTLRVLAWYCPPAGVPLPPGGARFTIEGLAESVKWGQVEVIRPGAGSAYEAWEKIGRPQFVNRDVLDALEGASQPAAAEVDFQEYPPRLEPGMVMQLTIPLPWGERTD